MSRVGALDKLVNDELPALCESAVALEHRRLLARRVDGQIIGTGEADFTKDNRQYILSHKDQKIQLLDVPGIEGDESKYTAMVEKAIAKAHLVFYVNGTNKKPEKATAEKIGSYLRWGTKVYPVVNVRGNADAYEFDEDRVSLDEHGAEALRQTVGVLKSVLREDVVLPGHYVQGLLAFSSLAVHAQSDTTTIDPSRERDLVVQQRNYRKHFRTCEDMFAFSQFGEIGNLLEQKLPTFKDEIVESNKGKVSELLSSTMTELDAARKQHEAFLRQVEPRFKECRALIDEAMQSFERLLTNGRENIWGEFFNMFSEAADDIIASHFGDKDIIESKLQRAFQTAQAKLETQQKKQLESQLKSLQSDMHSAMQRLLEDVQRIQFMQHLAFDVGSRDIAFGAGHLDMSRSWKEWGSVVFNLGSYALTGLAIGSAFPGIGNVVGAIAGLFVGVIVSIGEIFSSKAAKIRKAQGQVQSRIDEMRYEVMSSLPSVTAELVRKIKDEVRKSTHGWADAIYAGLARPIALIEQQLDTMADVRNQLKSMRYGTIQAIQR